VTQVLYLTAAQWGGTWNGTPKTETLLDPEVYVHHVGGQAWMGEDAVADFRNLNAYAKNTKGYQFLDYDVLVHYSRSRDVLTIGEGRGRFRSAATLDRNEEGEAVCVCGNFELRAPLPVELEGVALGIVYGIDNGWIAKDAVILGHRDNPAHPNATACPGRFLYSNLPAIRHRVAQLLNPPEVSDVNWNPTTATVNAVNDAPPTADVLAGKVNDWAVIALIKAYQERAGLPVTGKWNQALGDSVDKVLEP
jgi:hypothetical protein